MRALNPGIVGGTADLMFLTSVNAMQHPLPGQERHGNCSEMTTEMQQFAAKLNASNRQMFCIPSNEH